MDDVSCIVILLSRVCGMDMQQVTESNLEWIPVFWYHLYLSCTANYFTLPSLITINQNLVSFGSYEDDQEKTLKEKTGQGVRQLQSRGLS